MVLQRVGHDWVTDTFTFHYSPKAKAENQCRINFWDRWINLKIYQNYYNVINCNRFKSLTYWKFFIVVLLPDASLLLKSLLLFICNIELALAFKWLVVLQSRSRSTNRTLCTVWRRWCLKLFQKQTCQVRLLISLELFSRFYYFSLYLLLCVISWEMFILKP